MQSSALALWRCCLCFPARPFCPLEQFIETYLRLAKNQIVFGRPTNLLIPPLVQFPTAAEFCNLTNQFGRPPGHRPLAYEPEHRSTDGRPVFHLACLIITQVRLKSSPWFRQLLKLAHSRGDSTPLSGYSTERIELSNPTGSRERLVREAFIQVVQKFAKFRVVLQLVEGLRIRC
jgi:hypothetical protein